MTNLAQRQCDAPPAQNNFILIAGPHNAHIAMTPAVRCYGNEALADKHHILMLAPHDDSAIYRRRIRYPETCFCASSTRSSVR